MNRLAWTGGFYKNHVLIGKLLKQYREGLVVTSACKSGLLTRLLSMAEFASAKTYLARFANEFGEDFYVEVMPHNPPMA